MSYNGPLLTRSYGPNFKGTKLSILEMDNNLLYLEELAKTQIGANYAQTLGTQVSGITSAGTIVSVEIETNGYPVQVTVTGDANPTDGGGNWCQLQLYRDGSAIGNIVQAESSANGENIPFTVNYIDSPTAGAYTYTLEVVDIEGEFQFGEVDGPVITVVELANKNWIQTVGSQVIVPEGNDAQLVEVVITTTGAPIQIMVTGDANPTTDPGWCRLQLFRDGDPIGNSIQAESSLINENMPYALNFIDEVPSGTYTYTLRVTTTAGSDFAFGEVDGPVMTAVELVSGGGDNWAESDNSVIESTLSNVKGGESNTICCSRNSTIIGGEDNEISGGNYYNLTCNSGIFAGNDNFICGSNESVIIGGCCNQICTNDNYNAIIGGCRNIICGGVDYSAIVGGACNVIYGDADADYSAILGGCYNQNCYSEYGVILGGACNSLYCSDYSGILAGCCNTINNCSSESAILAGCYNCISGCSDISAILAGCENCITQNSDCSTIIGGADNIICNNSRNSSIISAVCACIEDYSCNSLILGGCCNCIACNSSNSFIIGSCDSCMCLNVKNSSIISGDDNCMRGGICIYTSPIAPYTEYCTVGHICASSTLAGCNNNIVCNVRNSVILGGDDNDICGTICQSSATNSYTCTTYDSAIMSSKNSKIRNSNQSGIISSCQTLVGGSDFSSIINSTGLYCPGYGGSVPSVLCNSNRSSIISSYAAGIIDSNSSVLLGTEQGSYICNGNTSVIIAANEGAICFSQQSAVLTGYCNHIACGSCSSILSGRDNCLCFVNSSNIIGGYNNNINYSNRSTIIGSINSCVVGSTGSMIIGGSFNDIINTDNVILIPTLTTSTFSAGNFDKWKLGKTASGSVTLNTTQYIEVEINGIVYKLGVVS